MKTRAASSSSGRRAGVKRLVDRPICWPAAKQQHRQPQRRKRDERARVADLRGADSRVFRTSCRGGYRSCAADWERFPSGGIGGSACRVQGHAAQGAIDEAGQFGALIKDVRHECFDIILAPVISAGTDRPACRQGDGFRSPSHRLLSSADGRQIPGEPGPACTCALPGPMSQVYRAVVVNLNFGVTGRRVPLGAAMKSSGRRLASETGAIRRRVDKERRCRCSPWSWRRVGGRCRQ